MVAGLKFLSKKGFNPQNLSNQKKVWEREQQQKNDAAKAMERERQLKRERDDEELAKARGDTLRLRFMYENPAGLEGAKKTSDGAEATSSNQSNQPQIDTQLHSHSQSQTNTSVTSGIAASLTERQPGDDDAAAAFRRLLAQASESSTPAKLDDLTSTTGEVSKRGDVDKLVMQGTSFDPMAEERGKSVSALSALEKAVGRKHDSKGGLTLEEQIQRFPALANAPRAPGMSNNPNNATNSSQAVTFKPLGTQIRNVRCLACGIWGHSRGDRECEKSGWNPFASAPVAAAAPVASLNLAATTETSVASHSEEGDRRNRGESKTLTDSGRMSGERKKISKRRRSSSSSSSTSYDSETDSSYERDRRRWKRHKEAKRHRHHDEKKRRSDTDSADEDRRHSRRKSSRKRKRDR
jgi:CBF1 interacting corepressor